MTNDMKLVLIKVIDTALEYGQNNMWPEEWDMALAFQYELDQELRNNE